MTPDELLGRLEEAGRTLKRTPIPLDEVLGWLLPLDADVRAVVLARACGASWRAIMRARQRLGYRGSHEHCRAIFRRGVSEIGTQLEVGLVVLSTGHD